MVIIINNYIWRQTDELIIIRVPVKNVVSNKIDLFISDTFIKVHYPPKIFECCLYDTIKESVSKCTVAQDEVIFELVKTNNVEWPFLTKNLNKQQFLQIKITALDKARDKISEDGKNKEMIIDKKKKDAIREQMMLDSKHHETIEKFKKYEEKKALNDFEEWKKKNNNSQPTILKNDQKMKFKTTTEDIPATRTSGTIYVKFTERAFPTPCRESKLPEEIEWLKLQAKRQREVGFIPEDLRPEESNPIWLLDKGKSFFNSKNYLGAISAYTHAIKLTDKMPELFIERSTAQYFQGNYRRVIHDTTKALELCQPKVEANKTLRFVSHCNRGKALLKLSLPDSALADFEEALAIFPEDQEIKKLYCRALETDTDEENLVDSSFLLPEDLE